MCHRGFETERVVGLRVPLGNWSLMKSDCGLEAGLVGPRTRSEVGEEDGRKGEGRGIGEEGI